MVATAATATTTTTARRRGRSLLAVDLLSDLAASLAAAATASGSTETVGTDGYACRTKFVLAMGGVKLS